MVLITHADARSYSLGLMQLIPVLLIALFVVKRNDMWSRDTEKSKKQLLKAREDLLKTKEKLETNQRTMEETQRVIEYEALQQEVGMRHTIAALDEWLAALDRSPSNKDVDRTRQEVIEEQTKQKRLLRKSIQLRHEAQVGLKERESRLKESEEHSKEINFEIKHTDTAIARQPQFISSGF